MRTVQLFHRVLVGPCRHMAFQAFCQTPISTGGHAIHQQGLLTLHKFLAHHLPPSPSSPMLKWEGEHVAAHPVWSRHCVFGPFDCPMAQVLLSLVSWLLHDHMYFSEVTFSQTVSLICVLRGFKKSSHCSSQEGTWFFRTPHGMCFLAASVSILQYALCASSMLEALGSGR